jgi:squalene-associated FAD-dependent desaturase
MAAAVTLAERGVPVTVFESGPVPGGRARRVVSQGQALDNGQHIFVGAYGELFRLMRIVGAPSESLLRMPLQIRYAKGFALNARLGMAAALATAKGVPLSEKMGAVRFMNFLRAASFRLAEDVSVRELLARHGQDGRIGHYLWQPLCVSALNTPADQASANVFLAALRDTLAGPPGASDLVLPRADLSRLFPEPAVEFVRARGGEVNLRTSITDLGELRRKFSSVVLAVGPHQLKSLLPDPPEFSYQPIYTCYLQYPEHAKLAFPMLGMADGLVQWVFDRGALNGERGRLACVISAQGDHQQMTQEEIAARCHQEVSAAGLVHHAPEWSRVIAEKRATITCAVGLQRPAIRHDGIVLAGDYTDPEYPPTLEAAVRSGVRAALEITQ